MTVAAVAGAVLVPAGAATADGFGPSPGETPPMRAYCDGRLATVVGGSGNDTLMGTQYDDVIVAGAGNDTIYPGNGHDVMCAGDGNDYVFGYNTSAEVDWADLGVGDDRYDGGSGADVVYGGAGVDSLYGNGGVDLLHGGADTDVIFAGAGNDVVWGDDGWDHMRGGPGDDWMYGGGDNDQFYPEQGSNTVFGGPGGDFIHTKLNPSAVAKNVVHGEGGDDMFDVKQGIRDDVIGGGGYDSVCADATDPLATTEFLSCV
ncbi:MAG: calcium-binding protein [Actinomycetota bacterium]